LIAAPRCFGRGIIHFGQGGLQRIGASSRRGGKGSFHHSVLLLLLLLLLLCLSSDDAVADLALLYKFDLSFRSHFIEQEREERLRDR
jgi:hypothetical protein